MEDPWSAMGEEEDETYTGPDAYLEDDDDDDDTQGTDLDMEIEDEVVQLEEEAESFSSLFNRLGPDTATLESETVITNDHIGRLLAAMPITRLARIFGVPARAGRDEDDDDDEDEWGYPRSSSPGNLFPKVTEPQPAGVKLLLSGDFGRVKSRLLPERKRNLYDRLRDVSRKPGPVYKEDLALDMVPNTHGTAVATYDANVYCGQYSADSSFYYTCAQDFWLHVYDTRAALKPVKPPRSTPRRNIEYGVGHRTTMTTIRSHRLIHGNWTITDSHLSPDNQRLIYSTMAPTVYMTNTLESSDDQTPISFADRNGRDLWSRGSSIWCCRFSADGNEVFAGGGGSIFVYDLVADQRTVKIKNAHQDDVNSCCWADTASGNVLVSGSDDGFVKVWDRRSLGSAPKPSGVLVGHTEGVTYVSAKGDGRYVISNGKDQALRLWDLRKMRSSDEFDEIGANQYGIRNYDYRQGHYPKPRVLAHPKDCSVMTYRGHQVLRTLIRCHFSPAETTGGQYLYSGSYNGKIHIWSLDGRVVQVLDRSRTLPMSYDPSAAEAMDRKPSALNEACVRDVSWHPLEPVLMSAAWESHRMGNGSMVARHEWKGLRKGGQLEDWVEKHELERHEMPGGYDAAEGDMYRL